MQLDFNVEEQTLTWVNREKTPVADSVKYLTAKFTFSDEWTGLNKTAIFFAPDGKPYSQILVDDGCEVPHEVIKSPLFKVSVAGGDLITTNIIIIGIIKSGYVKGETPKPPTPDVYTQILEKCDEAIETAKDVEKRANNGEFVGEKGEKGDKGEDYVLTDVDKEEISTMASNKAKAYTDEQAGTLVKKGENWTDKYVPEITKIILPSATYYDPSMEEDSNSFFIADENYNSWMAYTQPGETLIFDIANNENNLVTVLDEATGKEKAKVQDTWGIYDNIKNCVEIGADLGCIFYYPNDTKVYVDESCDKATKSAVEESKAYTDNKVGSLLKGNAHGAVVAIDDISPISKDIVVNMESKNLYYNTKAVNIFLSSVNVTSAIGESEITLNGSTASSASGGNVNTVTLEAGTYTFSVNGLNTADKINLQDADDKSALGTYKVGSAKTITLDKKRNINNVLVLGANQSYENQVVQIQIEKGLNATEYTPYFTEWDVAGVYVWGENEADKIHHEAWELAENGYKVDGFYPITNLQVEDDRTVMYVEYSRDLNKAFSDIEQAIISLGGNI